VSEQELLRSYAQQIGELQAELANYQRMLNLVGSHEAASAPSQSESPSQVPAPLGAATLGAATLGAGALGAGTLGAGTLGAGALGAGTLGAGALGAGALGTGALGAGALPAGSEFHREILDHLSDGFAQVHADGTLGYYNHAFAQLLSLPADIPGKLRLMDVEHLAACQPFAAALKYVLGGTPQYAQCMLTDQQGNRRVLECAATAVPDGASAFIAALVIRDQTEREQLLAHLTALNRVAMALTRSLNFDERLGFALTACREATAADAAVIYLIDAGPQVLSLAGADGLSAASVATLQATPLGLDQGMLAGVALDGEARAIVDLRAAPTLHPWLIERERLISGAFVALRDAQQITGVLGIFTRARRLFTEADIRLLTSIARNVGLSLHNARLHEQARQQAQHDGLTGLFNRGQLMELAAREYQRVRRHRSPLIVLMIDVDEFKSVNDSAGHVVGDRALQAVARMLREQTRSFDLVGRYGGDEFVVLLLDCTHAYAFEVVRRLHHAAHAIRVPTDTGPLTMTLSIGMAACKLTLNETLEQVLAEADREMYAIKNGSASGMFSLPAMG